jgi:hypothetical protein
MGARHHHLVTRAVHFFAAALLLAACARRVYVGPVGGIYTTTPFPVTTDRLWRVEDMRVGDEEEGLALYVEVGVCTTPQEQLLPVYVHGAPRGIFRVGQMIAEGTAVVKGVRQAGIRIVSPDQVRQLGCTPAND